MMHPMHLGRQRYGNCSVGRSSPSSVLRCSSAELSQLGFTDSKVYTTVTHVCRALLSSAAVPESPETWQ
ncbi:hypothetical protein V5799_023104 [Amblyomma americanum]|uniref:Uncharacterized protein n=1 Tax=Amblyomma americanum TaxID=6943 RepID=A0AAQ4FK99_AMBAM